MSAPRPLVGREPELAEVRASLERAAAGDGGLVLLVGEAGIGKTRLADEAAGDARTRGFEVVWGRCWEGEAPPAYFPWTQVLRALPRPAPPLARALAPVLPELGPAPEDAEAAGFRLLEAVMEHLGAAAARRPHLLILDDLHAADAPSLRVLELVVRSLRGRALLVLGSYRDAEARLSPPAARALARIAREGRALALRHLGRDETAALAEACAGRRVAPAVIDELHRITDGNPLFVAETVELLAARGELGRPGPAAAPVPGGVDEVIRGRLARLSPRARRALEIASVLGRELERDIGAGLLAAHGGEDPQAALAEAEAAGFGAWADPRRFRFSHVIVRDAIYASVPIGERRPLHLAASRLYEAAGGEALGAAAHHALAALPQGTVARAVDLAARAADGLARRLAFEQAAEMYGRAVRALPVVPADPLRRCDLLVALARCLVSAGAVGEARQRALEAAALARASEDGRRLAAAALAFGSEIRIAVVDPALVGLLEEALAALPDDDLALRPLVMARLAAARQPAPDPARPVALAREAIALGRRAGAPDVLLPTLHAALAAMADYAPAAERLPLAAELAALARARGERGLAMHAAARAFMDRVELGDLAGADADLAHLDSLAREIGHPRFRWRPLLMRAMRAMMAGRWDDVERLRAEAAEIAARTEDANFPLVFAMQGYAVALERADERALRAIAASLEAVSGEVPGEAVWRPVMAGLAFARLGLLDDARAERARLPEDHPALDREPLIVTLGGELAVALGDRPLGARMEAALRPWAGHVATFGQMGLAWLGPIDRVRGLLAGLRGARDEAVACLGRALAAGRAAGAAPFCARVERELVAAGAAAPSAVAAAPAAPVGAPLTMTLEADVWVIARGPRTIRLRASRGLAMLARLTAEPGRELHALELAGGADGGEAVDTGDAGPVIDRQARDAYRRRYRELEEAIDEAEALGDGPRAQQARAERERLADELARGLGLGGRDRRAGAASERARVNVQRRLKDAIERIAGADAELGRHVVRAVRTGTFCSYNPENA